MERIDVLIRCLILLHRQKSLAANPELCHNSLPI